jgi:kinetochore protein Spc7/SPC105
MASRDEITLPATRPKSRKSLAHHVPSANTMNKENMTADIGAMVQDSKRAVLGDRKKSRSKSIGPGGLDALKDTSGNRRKVRNDNKDSCASLLTNSKSIAAPPPRSILKPTLPPLRDIPPHSSLRNSSPKKPNPPSNAHSNVESKRTSPTLNTANVTGSETLPNPFSASDSAAVGETRVMLRTEEEQQAAAREREAKEQEEVQKDIVARRDARRKSLANRRVSFAPEATLHTWDVVEYMQDSTTSSASTNSTRRASTMSNETVGSPHTPGQLSSDPSEPPSTPPEQIEDSAGESPADQRNLHQRKRRRSSGIPPLNFNNPDDEDFSSSPSDGSSMGGDDMNEEFDDDDGSDVNSDSDDDGTAMSIDGGDVTVTATDMSIASVMSSSSSTGSSARLEQALQLAAQQAGTQGIDFDEHGSLGIEEEEEEIIASFAPWSTKKNLESSKDQENVNPFSPAFKAAQSEEDEEDDGTTMEMTRAVGRIMPGQQSDDEMTMEMTKAVGCIMPSNEDEDDGTMEMTMEMTRAVGRIMPSDQSDEDGTMEKTRALGRIMPAAESDDEMTMDMTMAVGGIIQQEPQLKTRRKSVMPSRRQSTRRRSSAETSVDDETMDFTMAIGGIQKNEEPEHDSVDDEDMAMEFTSVIGGVLAAANPQAKRRQSVAPSLSKNRRQSVVSEAGDDEMDMTVAVGKILPAAPSSTPKTSPLYPDLQTALDGILPQPPSATRPEAKRIMEEEVDHAELDSSPFQAEIPVQPQAPVTTVASETGSPSLNAFRGKGLRRSSGLRSSTMPKPSKQTDKTPSPQRKPATPSKQLSAVKPTTPSQQLTPQPMRPTTPSKTPPSKNVSMRTGSPHKLFAKDTKSIATTPMLTPNKKPSTPNKLFQQNRETGAATPSIVLKPQRRRSSGVGIDKIGLGSPRLAAILDRRGSIGENAIAFQPAPVVDVSKVRFGEAASIEQELDKELQEEKDRESGRKLMEREANGQDEKDVTVNLKEMIESLTPKKRPLKGRKSLHVGAAKGILGKRPAELDEEDEEGEEDSGGVKRLKNHQGSPVKNVKLKAPPSKEETTGRVTRATRRSLEATAGNATTPRAPSPTKKVAITTPSHEGHFKDTSKLVGASQPVPFPMSAPAEVEEPFGEDRIQLQEFLNMTSIRFMELTTTKRRHTVAPNALTDAGEEKSRVDGQNDATLEACVVAGACTVPMLELFQHVCLFQLHF